VKRDYTPESMKEVIHIPAMMKISIIGNYATKQMLHGCGFLMVWRVSQFGDRTMERLAWKSWWGNMG